MKREASCRWMQSWLHLVCARGKTRLKEVKLQQSHHCQDGRLQAPINKLWSKNCLIGCEGWSESLIPIQSENFKIAVIIPASNSELKFNGAIHYKFPSFSVHLLSPVCYHVCEYFWVAPLYFSNDSFVSIIFPPPRLFLSFCFYLAPCH